MKKLYIVILGLVVGLAGCGLFRGAPPEGPITAEELTTQENYHLEMTGLHTLEEDPTPLVWDVTFSDNHIRLAVDLAHFEETIENLVEQEDLSESDAANIANQVYNEWFVTYEQYTIEDDELIVSNPTEQQLAFRAPITLIRDGWTTFWKLNDLEPTAEANPENNYYFFENIAVEAAMTPAPDDAELPERVTNNELKQGRWELFVEGESTIPFTINFEEDKDNLRRDTGIFTLSLEEDARLAAIEEWPALSDYLTEDFSVTYSYTYDFYQASLTIEDASVGESDPMAIQSPIVMERDGDEIRWTIGENNEGNTEQPLFFEQLAEEIQLIPVK